MANNRLFKLIGGGSLTDATRVGGVAQLYALAGAQCIDIAPDMAVVHSVSESLNALPTSVERPLVMVSLPLDPDPHFRKMHVSEPLCTGCDACTSICPTDAIEVKQGLLDIEQPLCYGCGRCVPECPTDALSMTPHHPDSEDVLPILRHPSVEAVEIHSGYADDALIEPFLHVYGEALNGKQLAICFQASQISKERWKPFVARWIEIQRAVLPEARLVIQVDGRPMSGMSKDLSLTASAMGGVDGLHPVPVKKKDVQPAIHAACVLWEGLSAVERKQVYIMLSGGVNENTITQLEDSVSSEYVSGIGMGTVARQAVWDDLSSLLPRPVDYLSQKSATFDRALGRAKKITEPWLERGFECRKPSVESRRMSGNTPSEALLDTLPKLACL